MRAGGQANAETAFWAVMAQDSHGPPRIHRVASGAPVQHGASDRDDCIEYFGQPRIPRVVYPCCELTLLKQMRVRFTAQVRRQFRTLAAEGGGRALATGKKY